MYCRNCGAENSDQAKFCIKCGQQLAENSVAAEKPDTAKTEVKLKKRNKLLLAAALAIVIVGVVLYAPWPWDAGADKEADSSQAEQIEEVIASTEVAAEPVAETPPAETPAPAAETEESVSEASPTSEPAAEETQTVGAATWYTSTKEHDVTVNTILTYEDSAIWNFADCTAVGAGVNSDIAVPAEADYGFIVTVLDNDCVALTAYNNSADDIAPVRVTAGLASGEVKINGTQLIYAITGYADCGDGFGVIDVKFSNNRILTAGVFKENGRLYAVNVNKNKDIAAGAVDRRLVLAQLMEEAGITEADCVSTDPIYYPIVPVNKGEVTDTAYWVKKSSELVEDDWTDAHKIMTFYNYVIDNFAYDDWIIVQNDKARCFYYNDFSGRRYISNTNVGVCEDFSQVIAIMCRAQGIPALVLHNKTHAVTVAYIEDYSRWFLIDSTDDIENDAYQEDYTVWVKTDKVRYKSFGYTTATNFNGIAIGNHADMEKFGVPMFP